ncbi:MAG: hypothetical protein C5S41_06755 [Candidatus Methanomarinus sp.]|nr:MAG: hypothetical protein C5S41_06755 [ANME-2 cluster archaeon]
MFAFFAPEFQISRSCYGIPSLFERMRTIADAAPTTPPPDCKSGASMGWRSGYWVCIDIGGVDGSMFSNFLDAYKVVMIINVSKSRKYETRFTHVIGYVH